ncbi:MAG: Brp/Blh family beta-carotene 15,15'-monooxygenase [Polaromonas sp.]|jgi:Brp/Blh family beta-carotene 15,15'-monooxygenase
MTALRRQGLWFSILALATGLLSVVFVPLDPQVELLLAGLCIVLLGVPHGALDPIFAQALPQIKNRTAWAVFVLAYLLLAALVVALWWYAPTTFLFGFLAVSVLHFSGDLAAGANFLTRFFYGGAAIVLPAGLHAAELDRLFSLLTGPNSAGLVVAVLQIMVWPWLAALGGLIVHSARRDTLLALEVLAVSVLTFTASPLLGFTIFFCCMHSPRHILRTKIYAGMTLQRLAVVAVLPMLAVLLMAAGGWYLLPDLPVDERIIQFMFVALAALTVPHMVLVERVRFSGWPSKPPKASAGMRP